ncbi:MAG: adenylate/guanylate cyclase domain-containing protein [Campylobacterota bacterium]|nr:adenylate/guanylate cyclase domain-containing protein [Campylobacterota bacterium]
MKQILKQVSFYIIGSLVVTLVLSVFYVYSPARFSTFDNNLRDFYFSTRGELPKSNNVVIIDIDERALNSFGQWPWGRDLVANLVSNLNKAEVGIIGFDIIFAEKDKTSPSNVLKLFPLDTKGMDIPNFDEIFAQTLKQVPAILGYQFSLQDNNHMRLKTPNIPAIFIEKNKPSNNTMLVKAHGTILNIPLLQDSGYSSGFVNNIPDISGVTRSVPLLIQFKEQIFPSLSLEIIRNILGAHNVIVNYDQNGIVNIQLDQLTIPTDMHGRLLINYRGYEKHFQYISAYDILNNNFDKKQLEGKIALIGTSAAGLFDLRATPFESIFPGVEIHANAIDNMLIEDFIAIPSWAHGANIVHIFILSFLIILIIGLSPFYIYIPAIVSIIIADSALLYWGLFTYGTVLNLFFPILSIVLGIIVAIGIKYFFQTKQTQHIKSKFSSKVSKDVMNELLKNEGSNILKTAKKEVTVFFSDIRGFTTISEQISDSSKLVQYLNNYINPMSQIITKHHGTIDKYIGDSIMAYWNAPLDLENHCEKAVDSAIEQILYLKTINTQLQENQLPSLNIGIGIHTGVCTVGEVGSIQRNDYTIMGDTVNTASRLESLCKEYKVNIIISQSIKEQLHKSYNLRYLDNASIRGKKEKVNIYEVIVD